MPSLSSALFPLLPSLFTLFAPHLLSGRLFSSGSSSQPPRSLQACPNAKLSSSKAKLLLLHPSNMSDSPLSRLQVAIVGSGNVATHLLKALAPHAEVTAVNPRTLAGWCPGFDVALIAVSDSAIAEVASSLPAYGGILTHTSGSVPMSVLSPYSQHPAVLYPLQTFSRDRSLDYSRIPFFIEAAHPTDADTLTQLASQISHTVIPADSETRRRLHVASVLTCNFTNHLVHLADTFLKDNGLDSSVLLPLLHETVAKLDDLTPLRAQTGPAIRGDSATIESHLALLDPYPTTQTIYRILSDSIYNTYHHE